MINLLNETSTVQPITLERAIKIASKIQLARINKAPISIQAAIVDKCFNRCIMCDHPNKEKFYEVEPDDWCDFLEKMSAKGLESVCYSGGDPFAYKGLNKVMQKHIDLGMKFGILTAGYVPKNIDIELLKKAAWVRISLDTVDPVVYDKIRGLMKIERVLSSIDMMVANGIEVGLSPTLHNDNADHIEDVIKYAISKNIYVDVKTAYPGTYPIDKVNWSVFDKFKGKLPLRLYTGSYYPFKNCAASQLQLFIDSKGDIYPCCTIGGDVTLTSHAEPLGNISKEWDENWESINEFSKRASSQRPSACAMCQGRFTEINHVSEMIINEQVFF